MLYNTDQLVSENVNTVKHGLTAQIEPEDAHWPDLVSVIKTVSLLKQV